MLHHSIWYHHQLFSITALARPFFTQQECAGINISGLLGLTLGNEENIMKNLLVEQLGHALTLSSMHFQLHTTPH